MNETREREKKKEGEEREKRKKKKKESEGGRETKVKRMSEAMKPRRKVMSKVIPTASSLSDIGFERVDNPWNFLLWNTAQPLILTMHSGIRALTRHLTEHSQARTITHTSTRKHLQAQVCN